MKELSQNEMSIISGGNNRQCLIAGGLGMLGVGVGTAAGGFLGGAAALIGFMALATELGCFDDL